MIFFVTFSSLLIAYFIQLVFFEYGMLLIASLILPGVFYIYNNQHLQGWFASIAVVTLADLLILHYGLYNLVVLLAALISYLLSRSLFSSLSRFSRFFLTVIYAFSFQLGCLGISFINLGPERLAFSALQLIGMIVMSFLLAVAAVILRLLIRQRADRKELYAYS